MQQHGITQNFNLYDAQEGQYRDLFLAFHIIRVDGANSVNFTWNFNAEDTQEGQYRNLFLDFHAVRVDVAKMERGCGKYTSELCFQGVFTTFFNILVVASPVLRIHMR